MMRMILIDWLVRRHIELQVRRIAHFLNCRPVPRRQLQLVSVAAIFIASKSRVHFGRRLHQRRAY